MPELPEVETARSGIEPHMQGRTVRKVIIRQPRLRWPIPDELPSLLAKRKILAVRRRAKYLLIDVGCGEVIMHLGMSGSVRMVKASLAPEKHDHVDIVLDSGMALRLTDPRRFGAVLWQSPEQPHSLLASLGPEPLSDEFDAERLFQMSRGRTGPVKNFIMDNYVVVGVGNIYANEALFMAGIHPQAVSGKITRKRYQRLAQAIVEVLARAIEQGGTTLKDFVGGDGKPGYFKQELQVYGRTGEPCNQCGQILQEVRLNQRSTVFCKRCQR